tara:strand:+ start:3600 stop:3827 length:228 start_codon:yes stop_codon:yes gene_type:complete
MARRTLPKPYQNDIDRDFVMSLVKELEEITGLVLMKGERIEVNATDSTELVLISPNGTKYKISVDDAGNITTNAV